MARDGELLEFWIEADMFLRHMNRVLVGTMLEVASGARAIEDFTRLLDGEPRAEAGARRPRTGWRWRASPTSPERRRPSPRPPCTTAGRARRRSCRGRECPYAAGTMLNVLLTNDDGIEADGLQALRRALVELEGVRLAVIAPDGNRSAMARSITTRRPLWVAEVPFSDGTVGYATDGTPVDCVRLASLGLVEGFAADLVVAGINHGANLGDDITYSGTVAAALEGVVLGLPAIAVSQQSGARALDYRFDGGFGFERGRRASWRAWWSASRTCRCRRGRC